MEVREIMTSNSIYSPPDSTLFSVAKLMAKLDTEIMPVATPEKLLGVITLEDMVFSLTNNLATEETKVSELMYKKDYWCYEDDELNSIAERMGDSQLRNLVVLDRNKMLIGTISLVDVAQYALFSNQSKVATKFLRHPIKHSKVVTHRSSAH